MSETTPQPNILKTRDDHKELYFDPDGDAFKFRSGSQPSWLKDDFFGYSELRNRIEPWLTSLFQSEHLSLLAASGLTHAVHHLAVGEGAAGMDPLKFSSYQSEINKAAEDASEAAGRKKATWRISSGLPMSCYVVLKF